MISPILSDDLSAIRVAASNSARVDGLTHKFYRYPARFSPEFVSAAIECFSTPGQVVLDPYMGGGTSIVEAFSRGRVAIGCDLNSLAVFVARSKVTHLTRADQGIVTQWAMSVVPDLTYNTMTDETADLICPIRTRNLSIPRARPAKKLIALAMLSLRDLPTERAQLFARAILLNVAQWALNNNKRAPTLPQLRAKIVARSLEMICASAELSEIVRRTDRFVTPPKLIHATAEDLPNRRPFVNGTRANLVVTSPPYPGIHMLYHRWQVDGRKETPAPYWIAECMDGKGTAYYNFADRGDDCEDDYFAASLRTLNSVRAVMADGAVMVQMIAFSKPERQLRKYLDNMHYAGFGEIRDSVSSSGVGRFRRIWRNVPSRAWHASQKGTTSSAREVVLIHQAI